MKKKREIPCILYLYIHNSIWRKTRGGTIKLKELISYLFQWKIPKELRYLVLKEMEILGLISLRGTQRVEIYKTKLKDREHYSRKLNIY